MEFSRARLEVGNIRLKFGFGDVGSGKMKGNKREMLGFKGKIKGSLIKSFGIF